MGESIEQQHARQVRLSVFFLGLPGKKFYGTTYHKRSTFYPYKGVFPMYDFAIIFCFLGPGFQLFFFWLCVGSPKHVVRQARVHYTTPYLRLAIKLWRKDLRFTRTMLMLPMATTAVLAVVSISHHYTQQPAIIGDIFPFAYLVNVGLVFLNCFFMGRIMFRYAGLTIYRFEEVPKYRNI